MMRDYPSGVYCILNTIDGKRYVGSSVSLERRIRGHCESLLWGTHPNKYLQRAFNKHGIDAFQFQILLRCWPCCCTQLEQIYIDSFQSANPRHGYNICPIAGSSLGVKRSAKTKKKIGVQSKARMTPEMRKRIADALRGYKHSQETKDKVSAAGRGRKQSPESIEKSASKRRGQKRSQETRDKLSLINSNRSPEWRAKIAAANTGRKASDECKYKMTVARIGKRQSRKTIMKRQATIRRNAKLRKEAFIHKLRNSG